MALICLPPLVWLGVAKLLGVEAAEAGRDAARLTTGATVKLLDSFFYDATQWGERFSGLGGKGWVGWD